MNTKLQHASIRASAGTGKTYQLANRYVALLLLQAMGGGKISPEKIVALTFTRKGAGEFAERILHRLAAAAGSSAARKRLQADLTRLIQGDAQRGITGLALGVELAVDADSLQSALATMIDHFDRLVLGTIDGFMARSVQTLAFELGLGGFEILEAAVEREREELLGEVFRVVPPEDLENFFQLLKRATLKSSSSLRQELDRCVAGYHKLLHALPRVEAWGGSAFWNGAGPSPPHSNWQQAAASLAKQIAAKDFGHANIAKSLAGALCWLASRSPGSAGSVPSWLKEGEKLAVLWNAWPQGEWTFEYYKKARTVPASVMAALRPILEAWLAAECVALSQKTAAIHEIVSGYETLYDRLARRQGRLTFDDLPRLLDERSSAAASISALELLAFRWYQQFDHWLLDEFQDTSREQWRVLQPWLDEAIQDNSGTRSVFVVGDPKQSIYGWRDAEPRLFEELTSNYPGVFQEQIMAESWRSRPAVLELVNRVCSPTTNPALSNPDQFSSAALTRWQYDPHVAEPGRQSAPGYAAVLLTPNEETEADETAEEEAGSSGELAEKLAAQARVIKAVLERARPLEKGLSCAILVRKNKTAEAVAQWLRVHGVPQVMVEGVATLAKQSPMVAAMVDALRWLATPANTLAAGHVSVTPLWDVLKQPMKQTVADISAGMVWCHWQRRIADIGAPQVTHEWCVTLADAHPEPYAQYCLHHVRQLAQQAGTGLTLPDWLAALEQLEVRETAAAGSIHVMTIHKAKGLGFDVAFLPDLDSGSGGRDDILIRRDEQGCAMGCLSYPPKWLQAWVPTLANACVAQKAQQDLEALCVLYVALTRAKEATFVVMNREKPRKASPAREWLLSALTQSGTPTIDQPARAHWGVGELLWEHGERDFAAGNQDVQAAISVSQPVGQLPTPVARLKRRRPSDASHDASVQPAAVTVSTGGQEFGTAVHGVFEQIEWWTPDQALTGNPDAVALVRHCLAEPGIRTLFTRDTEQDEALRELPVEFKEANNWWSGVIDRLVLRRRADSALYKAVLIDFKTDHVDTVATLRHRYAAQLTIYRRAIAAALQLGDDQVETWLLSTHFKALLPG